MEIAQNIQNLDSILGEVSLSSVENNRGQIAGLVQNPRKITEEDLMTLARSIYFLPEMMELDPIKVRSHGPKLVTIGGNQRSKAIKKIYAGIDEVTLTAWENEYIETFEAIDQVPFTPEERVTHLRAFWARMAASKKIPTAWVIYLDHLPLNQVEEVMLKDNQQAGKNDLELFSKIFSVKGIRRAKSFGIDAWASLADDGDDSGAKAPGNEGGQQYASQGTTAPKKPKITDEGGYVEWNMVIKADSKARIMEAINLCKNKEEDVEITEDALVLICSQYIESHG